MAKINKKVINLWDGGIKTSPRSSDPNTSDGVQMIKGFDVYKDPKKLIPMQSWEDFNLESEKPYNIKAMGGQDDKVYGVGSGLSNWIGSGWAYRLKVEINQSLYLEAGLPLHLNMSLLPNDFWANIQSDLGDVRVTNSDGVTISSCSFENVNTVSKTGDMWINGYISSNYFYIYYGNPNVDDIPYGQPLYDYANSKRKVFSTNSMRWAYTFGDNKANNKYYADDITGGEESFLTDPTYVSGLFGNGINTTSLIETDYQDNMYMSGSKVSFSFMIYVGNDYRYVNPLYATNANTWKISIDTNGKIVFFVNGTSGNFTKTSTTALTKNSWNIIDCTFNGSYYIYINGAKQTFSENAGNYDVYGSQEEVNLNCGFTDIKLAQVWSFNRLLTDNQVTSKYNNFTNASFWTINSQETFSSINKQYTGVQLYSKNISSGNWIEEYQAGQPVKSLSYYPLNAWVDDTGVYFLVSNNSTVENGFISMAKAVYNNVLDTTYLELGFYQSYAKVCFGLEHAQGDNADYFNFGSNQIGKVTGTASEHTFASVVQSLASWRSYLAGAYTYRNRAIVDVWDLAATTIERLDCGMGNIRVVGNAGDTLFAVVDNFIDDEIKSSNKPTMEIRQYVGNGQTQKTHVIEIPAIITGYTDTWERAVSGFKIRRNTQTLFYARLPKDETGTTFDEGFWAVGKNSRGELSLTLQIDTEGLGMPEQVFGFAQQVFFIQKDGGIKRLSDNTYNNISLAKTLKMNEGNTNIVKKLYGFEVITEPLETNQVVSLYYKRDGDTSRTLIGMMTSGEISKEFTYQADGESFFDYKELEIEVESTGGKSAILEVNYKYEYEKDII